MTNIIFWSIILWLAAIAVDMEKSRSWPSAHDWKSCIPQKGIEGSNPSFSAIKTTPNLMVRGCFYLARMRDLKDKFKCPVDS